MRQDAINENKIYNCNLCAFKKKGNNNNKGRNRIACNFDFILGKLLRGNLLLICIKYFEVKLKPLAVVLRVFYFPKNF